MSFHRRRPRTPSLAAIYDEGAAAAMAGGLDPYARRKQRGDDTRSWLWRLGFEDEREALSIDELV